MSDEEQQGPPSNGEGLERRLARLIMAADGLCSDDEQRRDPLVDQAQRNGVGRRQAEQAYDIAVEEQVPPALALALVIEGISVRPLDGERAPVSASEATAPEWVDAPPPASAAARERRLRQTFRRMRSLLEDAPSPRDAISGLARAPDIELFDY